MDQAVAIAEAGARAGCHEALFTLGDQPERRYRVAREALGARSRDDHLDISGRSQSGFTTATGLLPHVNPGVMTRRTSSSCVRLRFPPG